MLFRSPPSPALLRAAAARDWAGFERRAGGEPHRLLLELCESWGGTDAAAGAAAAERLLSLGAWRCDEQGRTPLHLLCANDELHADAAAAIAAALLAGGVGPYDVDSNGDAALHTLCGAELLPDLAIALAHALLDGGASCTLEDAEGRTPCNLADGEAAGAGVERAPQPELAEMLRRRLILNHQGCGHKVKGETVVAGDRPLRQDPVGPLPPAQPEPEPEPEDDAAAQAAAAERRAARQRQIEQLGQVAQQFRPGEGGDEASSDDSNDWD